MPIDELIKEPKLLDHKRTDGGEVYYIEDAEGRQIEIWFYYDKESDYYVVEVIVEGAIDWHGTYETKRDYMRLKKELISKYPDMRVIIEEIW
jgi:hypothetical protein